MKCLIALSCLLAVASAGYLNHAAVGGVYGGALGYAHGSHAVAYNAPLSGHYGGALGYAHGSHAVAYNAPLSGHYGGALGYAHGSNAVAYNAPLVAAPHPVHVPYHGPLADAYAANTGPIAHGYAHGYAHAGLASEARLVDPVAIAAGAPLPTGDTVEVAAAKSAHYAAHAAAKSQHYAVAPVAHAIAAPFAHAYAAPVAHAYAAPLAHGYAHAGLASEARLVDPIAIAAGAPLPTGDTIEVAAAKSAHAAAHHAAKHGHFLAKRSPGYLGAAAYAAPLAYSGYAAPVAHSAYSTHIVHPAPLAYSAVHGHGYGGHYAGHYYG